MLCITFIHLFIEMCCIFHLFFWFCLYKWKGKLGNLLPRLFFFVKNLVYCDSISLSLTSCIIASCVLLLFTFSLLEYHYLFIYLLQWCFPQCVLDQIVHPFLWQYLETMLRVNEFKFNFMSYNLSLLLVAKQYWANSVYISYIILSIPGDSKIDSNSVLSYTADD